MANSFDERKFHVDVMVGLDYVFDFLHDAVITHEEGPRAQLSVYGFIPCGPLIPSQYKDARKNDNTSAQVCTFFCQTEPFSNGNFDDELVEKSINYFEKDFLFRVCVFCFNYYL